MKAPLLFALVLIAANLQNPSLAQAQMDACEVYYAYCEPNPLHHTPGVNIPVCWRKFSECRALMQDAAQQS